MTTNIWMSARVQGDWGKFFAFGQQTLVAVVPVIKFLNAFDKQSLF